MKTYTGDMHDYIYESQAVVERLIKQRKEIARPFVELMQSRSVHSLTITGAGTSCYSAASVRHFMEKVLHIHTYVNYPMLLKDGTVCFDEHSMIIGISSTGVSSSTIHVLDTYKAQGVLTMALTNDMASPIVSHVDGVIFLDHGIEDVSPKSKSYVAEMATLMLCALEYAHEIGRIDDAYYEERIAAMQKTAGNLHAIAAAADAWYDCNSEELRQAKRMLVLGYCDNWGNIQEGALKVLECGRFQCTPYELEEFMHGIYHSIHADTYIVYLLSPGGYAQRGCQLKAYLAEYTTHQFTIGKEQVDAKSLRAAFIDDEDFYNLEYIIPLHILAYRIAKDKGIDPNRPSDPLFHQKLNSKIM